MITVKNKQAISKMYTAGQHIAEILVEVCPLLKSGVTTAVIDAWVEQELKKRGLVSQTKGYRGYRFASCISINDEVVHGVPSAQKVLQPGDLVKIDVCASWKGYCADAARSYCVENIPENAQGLIDTAHCALNKGIEKVMIGNRVSDISAAIQQEVEAKGYGIIRDFAGHGIGRQMHEDPEILNYGTPGKGPILQAGMAFAIEPMITMGHYDVYVTQDGWTVKTKDKSLAAHVEDTVVVTDGGPKVITRLDHVEAV